MSFRMLYRINKHGLFDGILSISNQEAIKRLNTIRRKKIGNGAKLEQWMKNLDFRKEYRRYFEDGKYTSMRSARRAMCYGG